MEHQIWFECRLMVKFWWPRPELWQLNKFIVVFLYSTCHHLEFVSRLHNMAIYSYFVFPTWKGPSVLEFKPKIDSYSMLSRISHRAENSLGICLVGSTDAKWVSILLGCDCVDRLSCCGSTPLKLDCVDRLRRWINLDLWPCGSPTKKDQPLSMIHCVDRHHVWINPVHSDSLDCLLRIGWIDDSPRYCWNNR